MADSDRLRLFARVTASTDGSVKLRLWPIAQGASKKPDAMTNLEAVEAAGASLADRDFSDGEVRVGGLRVVHKQRLGKGLVFLGLRAVNGLLIESILRPGVLELSSTKGAARLHRAWTTGDVVAVTGMLERAKGRLSIHARTIEVEEPWAYLFGPNAVFRDDVVHGNGLPPGLWTEYRRGDAISSGTSRSVAATSACVRSDRWLLLLQVTSSHANRLHEYLSSVHRVVPLSTIAPIGGPQNPHDERLLLLRTDRPAEVVRDVLADGAVSRFVQRWYVVNQLEPTLNAAVDALANAVGRQVVSSSVGGSSGGSGADAATAVRIQCFPRSLEPRVVELLRAGDVILADPRSSIVLNVTYIFGALAVGLADGESEFQAAFRAVHAVAGQRQFARPGRTVGGAPEEPATSTEALAGSGDEGRSGGLVSRAFYKLREVASRMDLRLDVSHAIDVGASPGGWTVCLCQAGCEKVTAVDPGLLNLPAPVARSGKVEHLRMRVEDAIPLLEARGGVRIEMLVCDMNAPPVDVVNIATRALPLLVGGASLVLTFKNTYVRKAEWHAAVEVALEQLRTVADGVEVMHLLANTSRETTVAGRVRADWAKRQQTQHAFVTASAVAQAWERARLLQGIG
jgi:23S rRNA U2552 (ribose-2'-O)-methylase RlmE/FtsJ